MAGKTVYIIVTNDLCTDQRVHRTAVCFLEAGYRVMLTGRYLPGISKPLTRAYATFRLRMVFRRGFLFYAFFNFRLFWYLLFREADLLVANDLDTLPATFLVSRLKGVRLLYDSHEYFTEVPELSGRPIVRGAWKWMERRMLPGIEYGLTVNDSLARIYREEYGIRMSVVRNLPVFIDREQVDPVTEKPNRKVIIYQGALNRGRGLERMISAMKKLKRYDLLLVGDGDIMGALKRLVQQTGLEKQVSFAGRQNFEDLKRFTAGASLGISLEEEEGLNYYYALPNKLFDYIQARIPVLVSPFPEMKQIVEEYEVGEVLTSRDEHVLVETVTRMMEDSSLRQHWQRKLEEASEQLCWEKEQFRLREVIRELEKE